MPHSDTFRLLKRQNLIAQCKYYRDGEQCPKDIHEFWWNAEKQWVDMNYNHQYDELDNILELYISCGMGDYRTDDKVPSTLKSLMWKNQYAETEKGMCSLSFKINYETDYLKLEESPTAAEFYSHSKDIPTFARKYRSFFASGYGEDGYFLLARMDFYQEAAELGFVMDGGKSFERLYPDATRSREGLSDALSDITDVQILGNAILSQWRAHAHGDYSSEKLWSVRMDFFSAFNRLFELTAKDNDFLYRLSRGYLSIKATDIPTFARKYIHFFKYGTDAERYLFDDDLTFSEECFSFGFDMDYFHSYSDAYESDPTEPKMSEEEFIHTLTDINVIGAALHSQWRYYNHWAGPGAVLWDSREWFLQMFQRLLELS